MACKLILECPRSQVGLTSMYGVPIDLPIERFVGNSLTQVRTGIDGIHFAFNQTGVVVAFGLWQLRDADGEMID
jgi:hypothetical protein